MEKNELNKSMEKSTYVRLDTSTNHQWFLKKLLLTNPGEHHIDSSIRSGTPGLCITSVRYGQTQEKPVGKVRIAWYWWDLRCGILWLSRRKRWLPSKRSGVFFFKNPLIFNRVVCAHMSDHLDFCDSTSTGRMAMVAIVAEAMRIISSFISCWEFLRIQKWCKPPTFHRKQCVRCTAMDTFWFAAGFHVYYPLSCSKSQSRTSNRFLCDTMHTLVENISNFHPCLAALLEFWSKKIEVYHHQPPSTHPSTSVIFANSATYRVQTLSPASSQIPKWRVHHLRWPQRDGGDGGMVGWLRLRSSQRLLGRLFELIGMSCPFLVWPIFGMTRCQCQSLLCDSKPGMRAIQVHWSIRNTKTWSVIQCSSFPISSYANLLIAESVSTLKRSDVHLL